MADAFGNWSVRFGYDKLEDSGNEQVKTYGAADHAFLKQGEDGATVEEVCRK